MKLTKIEENVAVSLILSVDTNFINKIVAL